MIESPCLSVKTTVSVGSIRFYPSFRVDVTEDHGEVAFVASPWPRRGVDLATRSQDRAAALATL